MTCYNPIDAWTSKDETVNGKRSMVFRAEAGIMPVQLPCGRCDGCRSMQSLMWSVRCYHESTLHDRNSFVTFTYADAPPALVKKDLQDFFKRARHHYTFRYFACGEYGGLTRRPHYHAIIFGEDFRDDSYAVNDTLWSSPMLQKLWGHGMVSVGSVTMASACYVAGYVNKKIGDADTFSLMSRKPGIGFDWLRKYKDDLLRTGSVTIEGKEVPIPVRYLQWFEDEFADVKLERKQKVLLNPVAPDKLFDRRSALRNKELNKKAQLSTRKESL